MFGPMKQYQLDNSIRIPWMGLHSLTKWAYNTKSLSGWQGGLTIETKTAGGVKKNKNKKGRSQRSHWSIALNTKSKIETHDVTYDDGPNSNLQVCVATMILSFLLLYLSLLSRSLHKTNVVDFIYFYNRTCLFALKHVGIEFKRCLKIMADPEFSFRWWGIYG